MSFLKPGTLCVIVGGCPENIGLVVEVLAHLGHCPPRADTYEIRTVSGRPFHQLWKNGGDGSRSKDVVRGSSNTCITDRHKLRPLVDPKDGLEVGDSAVKRVRGRKKELVD